MIPNLHCGGAGMAQWLSICLPPMWPRFDSRIQCHMWVEFLVGSRPCSERFFSGTPVFPSPQKPTFPNSNSIWNPRATIMFISLGLLRATLVKQLKTIYFYLFLLYVLFDFGVLLTVKMKKMIQKLLPTYH